VKHNYNLISYSNVSFVRREHLALSKDSTRRKFFGWLLGAMGGMSRHQLRHNDVYETWLDSIVSVHAHEIMPY
jgi:hypothetical protein